MDDHVSRHDVAVYLEKLFGFVEPFENLYYSRLNAVISDLEERKKAQLLKADLVALGKKDPGPVRKVDKETLRRIYPDLPALVGGLYVLEGSVLGGAIIHRHLVSKLGDYGGLYFPDYGKEIGSKWKSFIAQLEAFATDENESAIIEGAKETFKLLDEWFCE